MAMTRRSRRDLDAGDGSHVRQRLPGGCWTGIGVDERKMEQREGARVREERRQTDRDRLKDSNRQGSPKKKAGNQTV